MSSIRNFIVLGVIHFLVNLYMWYKVYLFIYLQMDAALFQ